MLGKRDVEMANSGFFLHTIHPHAGTVPTRAMQHGQVAHGTPEGPRWSTGGFEARTDKVCLEGIILAPAGDPWAIKVGTGEAWRRLQQPPHPRGKAAPGPEGRGGGLALHQAGKPGSLALILSLGCPFWLAAEHGVGTVWLQ